MFEEININPRQIKFHLIPNLSFELRGNPSGQIIQFDKEQIDYNKQLH